MSPPPAGGGVASEGTTGDGRPCTLISLARRTSRATSAAAVIDASPLARRAASGSGAARGAGRADARSGSRGGGGTSAAAAAVA